MKKLLIIIPVLFSLAGCLRLEDNLYDPLTLQEYKLDKYTGEVDFHLDNSYTIPDSLIHIFTLPSQAANESTPTTIYAVYIGDISKISRNFL